VPVAIHLVSSHVPAADVNLVYLDNLDKLDKIGIGEGVLKSLPILTLV
jgi:hypothetical protein